MEITTNQPTRLIKLPEVKHRTGLNSTSIYQFAKDGKFPKQIKLGERSSAWLESEIEEWIKARVEKSR